MRVLLREVPDSRSGCATRSCRSPFCATGRILLWVGVSSWAQVRNTDGVTRVGPKARTRPRGCPGAGTQVQRLTVLLTSAWLTCCWGQSTGTVRGTGEERQSGHPGGSPETQQGISCTQPRCSLRSCFYPGPCLGFFWDKILGGGDPPHKDRYLGISFWGWGAVEPLEAPSIICRTGDIRLR